MESLSVLLMLIASAGITLGLLRLVIVTDLAGRLERHRAELAIRRAAATLIADVERFRRS